MKVKSMTILFFIISLLFSGCTSVVNQEITENSTESTVADFFGESETALKETVETSAQEMVVGSLAIGPGGDSEKDEYGTYRRYTGGEMTLPLRVGADGRLAVNGIGILIFIDGQPQPYKTDDEPEYSYMHTFYPDSFSYERNSYFVPVTGKEGDVLEFYVMAIIYPSYSLEDGDAGMVFTSGTTIGGSRLKYEATPPEETLPEKQMWLSDVSVTLENATVADFGGWSEEDMRTAIDYKFLVDDVSDRGRRRVYDVTADEPLKVHYELFGTHYVSFGLVFFVDNVPVFCEELDPILPQIENGQKYILEANLNLEDYDGESVIYAVLVPRNYRTSEVRTQAFVEPSNAIFLLEGSKPLE